MKYRPYFTLPELEELLATLKLGSSNTTLIRYLESFIHKISHGHIDPQYKSAPSLLDKLGMSNSSTNKIDIHFLMNKYQSNPSSLNTKELEHVHQYRYTNNLMNPDEESRYETSLLKNHH